MDNSVSTVLLVLLLILVHSSKPAISEKVDSYLCKSPQLLELGKNGSVQCLFTNNFNGVHWFNSTNVVDDEPIISLQGSTKYGSGYLTREYDIRNDGSLIIHNVTLLHELTFAVVVLTPPDDTLIAREVQVQVIVKPAVLFPVISTCSHEERICFAKLHLINPFTCTMGNSRPPVSVTLKVRTLYGDQPITGPYENKTMIAFSPQNIDTDDIWMSSSLVLLVCQVESNPFNNMLKHQTSLILLQNNAVYLKDPPIVTVVFNKDGQLLLECDYYEDGVIVWERSSSAEGIYKTSLYGSTGIEEFRIVLTNDGISESNGSLAVSSANFLHDGFYRCISSNIIYEKSRLYEAICIVPPSPPYPVIEGCNGTHTGCVLYFDDNHGIVECSIHRIYPKVDLAISLTSEAHSDIVTFYDKERKITEHGETYTITLKYAVSVESTSTDQVTLQCTIHDPPYEQLDLTTSFEIHLPRAVKRNEVDDVKKENSRRMLALLCLLVMLPIAVVIGWVVKRKSVCNTSPKDTPIEEERVPLSVVPQPRDDEGLTSKDKFMRQIWKTYAGFYKAVKPLPHLNTVMVNVNDIFVDGRIQLLTSQPTWEDLQSHAHILTDKRIGKRCLIEGPPGSGKSTLSLQFAYEWSHGKLSECADIVLLFQLRKLKNIFTLQQAVKELLLTQDSKIEEQEIEQFLNEFNSVVIIFDAYDEMPDQTGNNFIANILKNSSHQEFKVIVTTRSSCLPEEYSPSTSRIYLDGFNDKDRATYIEKAFKDEEDVVKTEIQRHFETPKGEDPIFSDIFKFPFFFVVAVHNWKENKGRYHRSVTYTVNLLLSSLVLHMNNKHNSSSIKEFPYSNDLNQVVFNSIIQKEKKLWTVDQFSKQFGENLLSVYKQLGILEYIAPRSSFNDEQSPDETDIGDNFTTFSKVAIRRKFIRDWFAAKYIVNNIVSLTDEELITFSNTLAEKAQEGQFHNIFQFACGIDVAAAAKILHIILQNRYNQKLAVWCIMEIKNNTFTERVRSLRKICKHSIEIAIEDKLYTQRMLRDFLELVADYSNHKVIIPSVILRNSYDSVDDSHENILLKSDLKIPSSIATEELCIVNSGAEFTAEDIKQLIEYARNVKLLKTVSLERCLVPFQLEEVTATCRNLRRLILPGLLLHRTIDVIWRPEGRTKQLRWYRLNSVGHWEDSTHEEITDREYKSVADSIKEIQDTSHTHLG